MCRFLLVKSEAPLPAGDLLERFADMAGKSRSPDGDRQGDGWGMCWSPDRGPARFVYKSLRPVWEDGPAARCATDVRRLVVHARSSSLARQKNRIEFNQPFLDGAGAFVFNGWLKGVSLPVEGEIGAQKIWRLLSGLLGRREAPGALARLREILLRRSARLGALNIGLSRGRDMYVLGSQAGPPGYYTLWAHRSPGLAIVCSEPLRGLAFEPLPPGRPVRL